MPHVPEHSAGKACHRRRSAYGRPRPAVKHPRWEPYAGKLHVRFWCSERLAVTPAGASPANTRSPVHVVVIPSGREGDQTAESLEVKALWGRGDLVRSVKGGRATWQAVA